MKDNPSKPRSIQSQGKKMKLVTISVCERWRNHQGECEDVTTFAPTVDKEVYFAGNAPTSVEKEVDSYGSGT